MATQLGALAVGSIVKLNVDGVPANFIVVQQGIPQNSPLYDESCNGTWLLMQGIYSNQVWAADQTNDYANSDIQIWLNDPSSGFLSLLDENILQAILQVKIPYWQGSGSRVSENKIKNGADGLSVKVFLLSMTEVGLPGLEGLSLGSTLNYFSTGGNSQRVAKYNGSAADWWSRTPALDGNTNGSYAVTNSGIALNDYCRLSYGSRPAIILNFQLSFVDDDGFVVVNQPPEAPASITVPELVKGGGDLLVSWTASTDPDGDPVSYELERSTDAAEWAQIYKGDQLRFTDRITKGWQTVQYRVRAVDSGNLSSGWTESEVRTVDNNTAPAIECEHPGGADLGEKAEPFAVNYTLIDPDGDPLTVTETVDGQTTRTETEAESGTAFEAAVLGDPAEFQKLLNGPHTLTITASDGKARTTHTLTFTKKVTSASVTLSEPLAVEGDITLAALRVAGSIPADALFTVEVTNNGNDDQPVWQDATDEVKRGANIVFTNHTAAKGAAFNFRLSVSRGPSGEGGYITAITGAFQ